MDDKGLIQAQYQQPQPVVQGQAVIHQQQMVPGQMMAMMAASAPIALDATLVNCFDDMEVCLCSMFCLPCQFGLTRQRAGLGHCAIGACMVMLPIIILYGIMAAVIITPEIKMINCLTDADNHALIQAANEAGVCNPADPMHCSVALQLCPSMAEFNHALISTYAMTPVFMIAMCSLMGWNRSKLQTKLGMPNDGFLNFIPYLPIIVSFCGVCAQCQEGRAVKARWQANGMMPLGAPQMPIQPTAVAYTTMA